MFRSSTCGFESQIEQIARVAIEVKRNIERSDELILDLPGFRVNNP